MISIDIETLIFGIIITVFIFQLRKKRTGADLLWIRKGKKTLVAIDHIHLAWLYGLILFLSIWGGIFWW